MPHIHFFRSFCVFAALALTAATASGQSQGFFFDDRTAFTKASERVRTIDFESVAPAKGFGKYAPDVGLDVAGISFRTHGGARFGSGTIYVPSAHYIAGNPGLKMLDGAHLSWGAPNQPGNAHLELTFPAGVRAFGADIWASQPVVSPIEVTVTTRDGRSQTSTITTRKRPDSTFVGFVSDSEIASIRFTLAKGQTSLLLDNLAVGNRAGGVDLASLAAKPAGAQSNPETAGSIQREIPQSVRRGTPRADTSTVVSSANDQDAGRRVADAPSPRGAPTSPAGGTIAYVRNATEIRTIAPDGSNDRRLFAHADPQEGTGIYELAWRPDGTELAFSSAHEAVASYYHADIFTVKPDGTGARRITNGPDRTEYSKYPKGTVTVTVKNDQPIFRTSKASAGVFFVYVVGADLPQPLTLPPGSSRTLTFKNVADFGDHAQAIVAVYGGTRWIIPGTDVKAGRVVKAPDFSIFGDGMELFGAFRPVWNHDGSKISYRNGACIVSIRSSRPSVGHLFDPVFKGENAPAPCAWDMGPTPNTGDDVLYPVTTDDEIVVYKMKASTGRHPGEKVATFSKEKFQWVNDIRWLPDGSGFLLTGSELAYSHANIFRHDIATGKTTQITNLEESFAKGFTVSPDAKWIVFERTAKFVDDEADLWIVGMDGTGMRLLVKDANNPAWRK
jgi:hypothetical protein